jgi:phage terminase large subunit-like protein
MRRLREGFTTRILHDIHEDHTAAVLADKACNHPFWGFSPRPDDQAAGDEQDGFVRSNSFISCALGGNGCLAPEQVIAGKRIEDHKEGFLIPTLGPNGVEVTRSSKPWIKGVDDLFEWSLSNGEVLLATRDHRVLTIDGWRSLESAANDESVFLSSSESLQEYASVFFRSVHDEGGPHCNQTVRGCWDRCLICSHQCDEQLPPGKVSCQVYPPSLVDVLERIQTWLHRRDLGTSPERNHFCRRHDHLARMYSCDQEHQFFSLQNLPALQLYSQSFGEDGTLHRCDVSNMVGTNHFQGGQQFPEESFGHTRTSDALTRQAREVLVSSGVRVVGVKYLRNGEYYDITTPPYSNYQLGGVWNHNSGKTYTAAIKACRFFLETPAPVKDFPYWAIADSYEQVMSTVWFQKLRDIIPREWIDWPRITWYNEKRGWPMAVPMVGMHGDPEKNWIIEFKSYEQGREKMQAASIGGAWFTEQFPWQVFLEVLRGCREHTFPGAVLVEQTPVDPEKSVDLQEVYEEWLSGEPEYQSWRFYRLNTESALNAGHVTQEWYQTFFGSVSEEMQETRKYGLFSSYEGAIYQSFRPGFHLIDSEDGSYERDSEGYIILPSGWYHRRALDWGASEEHPFCCLWGARDSMGRWIIYDEYWSILQTEPWSYHVGIVNDRHAWRGMFYGNTYGDPSRPDLIREFSLGGVPVVPARNDVMDGIEAVRQALKAQEVDGMPGLLIDKMNCPVLSREMTTYRWMRSTGKGVNPKAARPEPLKKNDDAVDTLRYLIFSEKMINREPDLKGFSGIPDPTERNQFRKRKGVQLDRSHKSPYQ